MNNYKVNELIKEIESENIYFDYETINDLLINFGEYNNGYICDIITEVTDSNIDIYDYNLWNWARDNEKWIEEAVCNFGIDHKNFSLMQLFQMAQYEYYTSGIYDNLDIFIKYAILKNIQAEEITEEVFERIEEIASEKDNNAQLENYIDEIDNLCEGVE